MKHLSVNLPNDPQLTDADTDLLREVQPGDGMLYCAHAEVIGSLGRVVDQVRAFDHHQLLIRMMEQDIPKWDAADWAEKCYERLVRINAVFGDWPMVYHIIPGNEMNRAEEGGHKGWLKHARWLEDFAKEWWALAAPMAEQWLLHLPAPHRRGGETGRYWKACRDRQLEQWYGYADIHASGDEVAPAIDEASQILGEGWLYWLTEVNGCPMATIDKLVQKHILSGANWYTLSERVYDETSEGVRVRQPVDANFALDQNPDLRAEFCAVEAGDPGIETPAGTTRPPLPPSPPYTRAGMIDQMIAVADREGLPRSLFLACALAESDIEPGARRPAYADLDESYWPDVRFGPFQQLVRWAPGYTGGEEYPGPEIIADIEAKFSSFDYALAVAVPQLRAWWRWSGNVVDALCRYSWPERDPATNPHRPTYVSGVQQAFTVLGNRGAGDDKGPFIPEAEQFDPDTPLLSHPETWASAACSLAMAFTSIGAPRTWWEVNEALGGHHAGEELTIATLVGGYSAGYAAPHQRFTWQELLDRAGKQPVLLGSEAWNRWIFVRRYDELRGVFEIGNPDPSWMGNRQILTMEDFAALGNFSVVWIDVRRPEPRPQASEPMFGLVNALIFVCDNLGDTIEHNLEDPGQIQVALADMRRIRRDVLGASAVID